MYSLDPFDWLASATARDQAESVLRLILVRGSLGVGADGIRLHAVSDLPVPDGLYDVGTRFRVEDPQPYPAVDRLYQTALDQPVVSMWSAQRSVAAAAAAHVAGRRNQLQIFTYGGAARCMANLVHDALAGFVSWPGDAAVVVHAGSPRSPVALVSAGRFAVIMPTLEPPADAASLIAFNPV